jgi:uncharacterized protein (UPF0332 family)
MSFNWRDFYALAENPGAAGLDEARVRTCVSRAYYAAFGVARQTASKWWNFKPRGTAQDHALLVEEFKKHGSAIADSLERLRTKRNMCDYEDDIKCNRNIRDDALRLAKEILDKCPK